MRGHLVLVALVAIAALPAAPPATADATSLAGKKIALDPGHGGTDPGAVGFGLEEQAVNLDVGLRARDLLLAEGASVILTRTCDCTVSLADRVATANNNGANRFIAIHSNACGGCGGTGTETYYHTSLSSASTSAQLATAVQDEMVDHLQLRDRGVKQADFYVLRNTNMPAVLVELGFIDTSADNAKLASPSWRQEAARAILHAVQRHYGVAPHDPAGGGGGAFAVSITAPAANAWVRATVTAQGSTNQESNLNWLRFFVDGTLAKWVTPAPHAWSWDTSGLGDGSHALTLEGENLQGARDTDQRTVRIDNTPPATASAAAGTAGTNGWFRSAVTVTLSPTDAASGVAATKRSLDGAAFVTGTSLNVAGDAIHSVRYFSQDVAGNVEATKTRTVKIDATPPAVAIADPRPGNAYVNDVEDPVPNALPETLLVGTKTVRVDAADATSGVARVEFRVDGQLRFVDAAAPYEFTWAAGQEGAGDHRLEARAVDDAGNSATHAMAVKTAPTTPEGAQRTVDGLA